MTSSEQRDKLVQIARSREKKNQYTQGAKRTQVGSGYSDCSSFVRWCYLQLLGLDIGLNTVQQITNKKLAIADNCGKSCPNAANLLPGDLLYFKGTDKTRPYQVGHVELYIGGGKCIGHGSGVGPTVKAMQSYCASRASAGKGYIRALRVIPPDAVKQTEVSSVVPADPMKASQAQTAAGENQTEVCLITGGQVNLRAGPGTDFPVIRVARAGERYPLLELKGWRPVLLGERAAFVAESMSKTGQR